MSVQLKYFHVTLYVFHNWLEAAFLEITPLKQQEPEVISVLQGRP